MSQIEFAKYRIVPKPGRVVFNVSRSFKVQKILGEGAYGIVGLATHDATGIQVAIKRIEPFDKPLFCLRTLREIKLLEKFKHHENIITLYDVQKPQDFYHFDEVYLIQEFMPTDLFRVIGSHVLTDEHCQYFTYQILRALKYIHSANVIHRDLKPSNILVNDNCDLKICDFGLSRLGSSHQEGGNISLLTEYVATRWYRAPEIMLSASQYSVAVDIWAVGCIIAELFTYVPLFPGSDYRNQLNMIFGVLGTPVGEDLKTIKSTRAQKYIQSLPFKEKLDLTNLLNNHPLRIKKMGNVPINPEGIDLLEKLLVFVPEQRISASEALSHPYLLNYHDPEDEPETNPMSEDDFFFDVPKGQLDTLELKKTMYNQIMYLKQ